MVQPFASPPIRTLYSVHCLVASMFLEETVSCFGLFNGHPQVILTILNIKIRVTIPTSDPLCIVYV
jgi:hypothetical protein